MGMHDEELDELEATEAPQDDDDDLGDLEDVDLTQLDEEDLEQDEEEPEVEAEEEEGSDTSSLDELLAQRAASRRGTDEAEDNDDIMALASERDLPVSEPIARVLPLKERQEFVCARCHLVKARSQLADPARKLCRDCV